MNTNRGTRDSKALDLPGWLAYAYKPVLPLLEKLHVSRRGTREHNPADILLPEGYVAELVASGFDAPDHCCFDGQGACYVFESGHKVEQPPRILKVDPDSRTYEVFFELPRERWIPTGAVTGGCWHEGHLYVCNTDTLSRIGPDGRIDDIVTGLPGLGDHQANYPVAGPDGKLYFGVGSATNAGVVGPDNAGYEWLPKHPQVHDVPARDLVLRGLDFASRNVLGSLTETVATGAFVPFGTPTSPGHVVRGNVKCSGSVLRCEPDGSGLEVVAWGLRNPYGIAFAPDGKLYVTEHGSDERGARYIVGDPDDFYQIEAGRWYGWPDFASGIRLDDAYWGDAGKAREPVLQEFPEPQPPRPVLSFEPHAAANGFDFCRDGRFGFAGDAFVALFGDLFPLTTTREATPAGFKVVRIDMKTLTALDFAVNRIAGPASKLPHAGFERPSHCAFGPDGCLYVVDSGEIDLAPERGGIRMKQGTGSLWRIRRVALETGELPPKPATWPVNVIPLLAAPLAIVVAALVVGALLRRRRRGSREPAPSSSANL
ncbi:MAG TPA: PQQ-dependent sugar dehydrogenase [Dehalococcoidia bacterium]|nr:PQQ-dependent sugar dehydrogenase [Dehalococcoidia bacterium]